MKRDFELAYKKVFDENGKVLPCGRDKCIELINEANKLRAGDYGNSITGYMNIDKLQELYKIESI